MSLAVGDILEFKILGSLLGQKVMSVFHYRIDSYTASGTEFSDTDSILAQLIAESGGSIPLTELLNCQTQNYIREQCNLQKVAPTRSIYVGQGAPATGAILFDCTNPNICAVLTKRGATGGRRGIGGLHIPGLPPSASVAGSLSVAYSASLVTLIGEMTGTLNMVAPTANLAPVIYNPGATPNFQYIAEVALQTTVRTMHRRTVGLGI